MESGHAKITLTSPLHGKSVWFIWDGIAIYQDKDLLYPTNFCLDVPYLDQLENADSPFGTCNVTSVAMCLLFLGVPQKTTMRFPDELDAYCTNYGLDRHNPDDLVRLTGYYGSVDRFTRSATEQQVKEHLLTRHPCITHTWLTKSGHIIVIRGFDQTGFFVNDPYGEYFEDGYDTNDASNECKGKKLHYSYDLFRRLIDTGGEFWVHFIGGSK